MTRSTEYRARWHATIKLYEQQNTLGRWRKMIQTGWLLHRRCELPPVRGCVKTLNS